MPTRKHILSGMLLLLMGAIFPLTAESQDTPSLNVEITAPTDGKVIKAYDSVDFTAKATGGCGKYNYKWTFENGIPKDSTSQNPKNIIFKQDGEGKASKVTVTATDKKTNKEASTTVTIVMPTIEITTGGSPVAYEHISTDGLTFKLECKPENALDKATAFEWKSKSRTSPRSVAFPFISPDKKETGIGDLRWYPHGDVPDDDYASPRGGESSASLRWEGNSANPCAYEVTCLVTFPNNVKITAKIKKAGGYQSGKYFYVACETGGATTYPSITNLLRYDKVAGGAGWKVNGVGGLTRVGADIVLVPSSLSEFYEKTLTHERTHKVDWNAKTGANFTYYDVNAFYNTIKNLTEVETYDLDYAVYLKYVKFEEDMKIAFPPVQQELRAYHSEYNVAPVGIKERSDTWIQANANNPGK